MRQGIDQQTADTNAMLVLPCTKHFAQSPQVPILVIINRLGSFDFILGLGDFPSATLIGVGVYEAAVALPEDRLNLDVEILKRDTYHQAIHGDLGGGIAL